MGTLHAAGLDAQDEPTKHQFPKKQQGLRQFRDRRWKSSRRGESRSTVSVFVTSMFGPLFLKQAKTGFHQK